MQDDGSRRSAAFNLNRELCCKAADQILSFPVSNYGEVQTAKSRSDFIHKMRVVLKELKICRIALKIIIKKELIKPVTKLVPFFTETEELIAIIAKNIESTENYREKP